ncbi:MAG: GAF domain-containing protein, partial [Candidatus Rokubacteria bacterium]|nr:GAF domain-containing protein [Candidatus Rokubacteria bacterium]
FQELQARNRDLTEALEQQTATAEILRVISSSPTDLQPMFDAVAQNAARLCGAPDVAIFRTDGDVLRVVASVGPFAETWLPEKIQISRGSVAGRAVVDRTTIHIRDLAAESDDEYPVGKELQRRYGHHTVLVVPLVRGETALGVIAAFRTEVRPFTEKQITLLTTFADQAVIAIENVRLFQELQARNRDLSEALEQQTATAEILRVISSSPTDLQPVFDAVAQNAARLCEAGDANILRVDGEVLRPVAGFGPWAASIQPDERIPITRGSVTGRAVLDRATVYVEDLAAESEEEFPVGRALQRRYGHRTMLGTPLLRGDTALGAIAVVRTEVRPFSDKQIALLRTFADQAVIAIENVRLFQEVQSRNRDLTEALEQQTATAEILRVISSSPTDLQPVLDAVAENAARVCGASDATVLRIEREALQPVATYGRIPVDAIPVNRGSVTGRAFVDRRTVHIHDLAAEPDDEFPVGRSFQRRMGHRTTRATPLLREGVPIGAILIRRMEVRPFTEKQIKLLETFADQAVIAIENVRLFQELQARTQELARSVEELKALGEVGQAVSSTLDIQTVLSTIVSRATQLSGMDAGAIYEYDETREVFELRATENLEEEIVGMLLAAPIRRGEGATGRMAVTRQPIQIPDIAEESYQSPVRDTLLRTGYRALLAVPLLREDHLIGGLTVNRKALGEFPPKVIDLLQTFATQSALAIQNARLFREIEEKGRQLEVASRHKSQFLANMSHELRTPLNAILGYTELILDSIYGEVPEKLRYVMERVERSGRHLLGLINVQTVFTAMEALAAEKKLTLKVEVTPDLPAGRGDERRLSQVLLNLVGNAVKFTEAGEVRVEATARDGQFLVSVSDTGPGIAPADQQKIFEEFQQADTSSTRKKGGTGLGLAIAKRIIEL